jgi:hypothetical protein
MKYSDDYQDEATQFEPTPWGSRQRVMPRRGFKAAASIVAPLPPAVRDAPPMPMMPPPVLQPEPSWFEQTAELPLTPILRERDLPTWRVPKLPPAPNARRFDMRRLRLWLPIAGLITVLVLAFFGTRSNATHISAALTPEAPAITMATIEAPAPVLAPVAAEPVAAPIEKQIQHAPVAKRLALAAPIVKQSSRTNMRASSALSSSKRPRLDMNVATPLGDLAKRHR